MANQEINFARSILKDRRYTELSDQEILDESQRLLDEWMAGTIRMERPKLYDHYALLLLALIRQKQELTTRIEALETQMGIKSPAPLESQNEQNK